METWQEAKENTVKGLLMMLKEHALDPTWMNYGDYIRKTNPISYHPEYRKTKGFKKTLKETPYHVSGNFYTVSWGFSFDVNEADAKKIRKAVDANKGTKAFSEAFNDRFNAISFDKTVYPQTQKYLNCGKGQWYITSKDYPVLPTDATQEQINEVLDGMKGNPSNSPEEVGVIYVEKHFRNDEEYHELRDLIVNPQSPAAGQLTRFSEPTKGMKEYTFKCTGRRVLMDITPYTTLYTEVDKVIISPKP